MQHLTQRFHPFVHLVFRIGGQVVRSVASVVLRPQAEHVLVVWRIQLPQHLLTTRQIDRAPLAMLLIVIKVVEDGKTFRRERRTRQWRRIEDEITPTPLLQLPQ